MIDYVIGGEYLDVISNKGAQPYLNTTGNQPMVGAISFDSGSQQMKVYDGYNWKNIGGGTATINLTSNAINILKWAEKKMVEEQELNILCDKHPSIKDLVDQMNRDISGYKHKISMIKTLIKEEEKVGTS
jgi:hypothetical protein